MDFSTPFSDDFVQAPPEQSLMNSSSSSSSSRNRKAASDGQLDSIHTINTTTAGMSSLASSSSSNAVPSSSSYYRGGSVPENPQQADASLLSNNSREEQPKKKKKKKDGSSTKKKKKSKKKSKRREDPPGTQLATANDINMMTIGDSLLGNTEAAGVWDDDNDNTDWGTTPPVVANHDWNATGTNTGIRRSSYTAPLSPIDTDTLNDNRMLRTMHSRDDSQAPGSLDDFDIASTWSNDFPHRQQPLHDQSSSIIPTTAPLTGSAFPYSAPPPVTRNTIANHFDMNTQEDVMRELQSFAEDHMSVLTGDGESHALPPPLPTTDPAITAANRNAANFQRRLSCSTPTASRGSSGNDESEIPYDLLVNYMMAMGANRETAEQLALSFAAEQNGGTSSETSPPRATSKGRHVKPSKMTLSSKLKEAEQGHYQYPDEESVADSKSIASYSVTGQNSTMTPPPPGAYGYSNNTDAFQHAKIVEAMAINEEDDTLNVHPLQSNLPIVYADTTPLSFKHLVNERPVRRLVCIGIMIVLAGVIAVVVYFTVFQEDRNNATATTDAPTMSPSLSPTFISDEILETASKLSGWDIMSDPSSPQFRAVGWMSSINTMEMGNLGDRFAQRYALVVMYYSFMGADWINQERWLTPDLHECEWSSSIFCRSDVTLARLVTGFDATRNNLQGSIPNEIGLLSNSETFRIPKNNVGGSIPDGIGSMISLSVVDLKGNLITGSIPNTIGGARDLILIDFSDNQLSSSIPNELFSLKLLRTLVLNTNTLTGELDSSINQLAVLVTLDLRHNEISGTIPVTVDSIETLDIIQLDYNQFSGPLPEATNSLARKQTISLSHNSFSGNVEISPAYFLSPNITNFRIQYVDVSYNDLSGPVSPVFAFMPTLRHFDLSGNRFIGGFPSDVGWESIEFLAVASNGLTGTIPVGYTSLSKLPCVMWLYVAACFMSFWKYIYDRHSVC